MSEFFMNHKKEPQEEYNVQEPNEIVACFIDWLVVGGHGFLMTLGLQASGDLILLHISRSRLNDVQATHLHLETLCAMGHKPKKPMLFVVNGSTCLRHLVPGILGEFVVIQRCQMRCAKDLMQSVPAEKAKNIEPQFQEFFELTYSSSQAKVKDWGKEFEENFPAVAANFMENSEETMTINRMEVPMPLRITLSTTSMIWQQPPGFMAELEKAVKEGLPDGSLLKLKTLFKKRLKELSPIVGFADIWLLKPALKEEVKLLRPDLVDYRDLLAENNEEEKKPIILSRRKHKRMIVKGLQCIIQHTIEANVLNMSMSGLTSQTHLPLKIGELHHIRLRHNKGEARLIGKVIWCRLIISKKEKHQASQMVYLSGLQFENALNAQDHEGNLLYDSMAKIDLNRRVFGRFETKPADDYVESEKREEWVPFRVLQVSLSGIVIQTESLPLEGALNLEIHVGTEKLKFVGMVTNVEDAGDPAGVKRVSIEFQELPVDSRKVLANLVQKAIEY